MQDRIYSQIQAAMNDYFMTRKSFNRYQDKHDAHVKYLQMLKLIQTDLSDKTLKKAIREGILLEKVCSDLYNLCKEKQTIINNIR